MNLQEWLNNKGLSFIDKQVKRHLNQSVVREISSVGMDWDEYIKELHTNAPFKANYVYCFVILENGYAVGLNENPSKGYSTPVIKYKGKLN